MKNTPNSAQKPILKDRVRASRESAANGKRTGKETIL